MRATSQSPASTALDVGSSRCGTAEARRLRSWRSSIPFPTLRRLSAEAVETIPLPEVGLEARHSPCVSVMIRATFGAKLASQEARMAVDFFGKHRAAMESR